jgi:hypothetical protein
VLIRVFPWLSYPVDPFFRGSCIGVDPSFSVVLFSVFPWSRHEFQPGYVGEVARIQCPESRLLDNRARGDCYINLAVARPS